MEFHQQVERWRELVGRYFHPDDVDRALFIMSKESAGDPDASNPGSSARGLFQHLARIWVEDREERASAHYAQFGIDLEVKGGSRPSSGWTTVTKADVPTVFDPEFNVAASAWLVYKGGGWFHWSPVFDFRKRMFRSGLPFDYRTVAHLDFVPNGAAMVTPVKPVSRPSGGRIRLPTGPFQLSAANLTRLFELNNFPVPTSGVTFFGLRGMLPRVVDDHTFAEQQSVILATVDYSHPRCTIGLWRPERGDFAVFPASTCPHQRYVKSAIAKGGAGVNQMVTGFFSTDRGYKKGRHLIGSERGHDAFRQNGDRPIRRSKDDFDFDEDDRVEFENPFDNLHAAWVTTVDTDTYSSAGCQVIVGEPRCVQRGDAPDTGPWKVFKDFAYGLDQELFPYVLLTGQDAARVAAGGSENLVRVRFGSTGALVETVQKALEAAGHNVHGVDRAFGKMTLTALLAFQEAEFGVGGDDGIVGPQTAEALGIAWPVTV